MHFLEGIQTTVQVLDRTEHFLAHGQTIFARISPLLITFCALWPWKFQDLPSICMNVWGKIFLAVSRAWSHKGQGYSQLINESHTTCLYLRYHILIPLTATSLLLFFSQMMQHVYVTLRRFNSSFLFSSVHVFLLSHLHCSLLLSFTLGRFCYRFHHLLFIFFKGMLLWDVKFLSINSERKTWSLSPWNQLFYESASWCK
jgi:hypothetical protein